MEPTVPRAGKGIERERVVACSTAHGYHLLKADSAFLSLSCKNQELVSALYPTSEMLWLGLKSSQEHLPSAAEHKDNAPHANWQGEREKKACEEMSPVLLRSGTLL